MESPVPEVVYLLTLSPIYSYFLSPSIPFSLCFSKFLVLTDCPWMVSYVDFLTSDTIIARFKIKDEKCSSFFIRQ
jgi:hypothetical protein